MLFRPARKSFFFLFTSIILLLVHHNWKNPSNIYVQLGALKNARPYLLGDTGPAKVPVTQNALPPSPALPLWATKTSMPVAPSPKPANFKKYMLDMLKWDRPTWTGHWPPYGDYADKGYDPNRWQQFKMDYRPYAAGHDKLDNVSAVSPQVYNPFPSYNSPEWHRQWKGDFVACMGPRGIPLNISTEDRVHAYPSVPKNFPKPFAGSYEAIGLQDNVCFDRYSRFGPYESEEELAANITNWNPPATIPNWNQVKWGQLQNSCLKLNKNRYRPEARDRAELHPPISLESVQSVMQNMEANVENGAKEEQGEQKYHHRTAVLIRAWTGYKFEPNDIKAIRSMVSELSLQSGGEYTVFIFLHVKDSSLPIFADPVLYDQVLRENVPPELQDITILWSESVFPEWYPEVTDWQVYWQQFMCVQWFSLTHPEFDYVWNWETDARYIGHHYHFLEKVAEFADAQPRKLLWERNKRYYLPSVHGSYKNFVERTHADILNASARSIIPPPVWGARPWPRANPPQKPSGPRPPTFFDVDKFEWGVNEPADFITLLPMWDPRNTSWSYRDKIWNYLPGVHPLFTPQDGSADWFTHPDFKDIDRRVFINTVVRFSKRLLLAMHEENLVGRTMQAEMWPSTVALQHGLKAVYAPHPIFNDRFWPAHYADGIFNAKSTVDPVTGASMEEVQGAWGEQADSPYNHDREYNFKGWSWYFSSDFPRTLYRRWLGWQTVFQDWGEEERIEGGPGADGPGQEKRMCMPGMLLHPVKAMNKDRLKV